MMTRREVSAGGLIWRRNSAGTIEVALIKPAGKEVWALPKGHVEAGESIIDAAIRECREETGLEVSGAEPLGEVSYFYSIPKTAGARSSRILKRVHFFLMRMAGGDPSAHDDEIDRVEWVDLNQALDRASYESDRELIEKASRMIAKAGVTR